MYMRAALTVEKTVSLYDLDMVRAISLSSFILNDSFYVSVPVFFMQLQ